MVPSKDAHRLALRKEMKQQHDQHFLFIGYLIALANPIVAPTTALSRPGKPCQC
jgi:hypothetical protein